MELRRSPRARWLLLAEIGLVFVVFAIEGARPVPEVNEPYYLGKAIHYWNPDWIPHDPFLDSADTHKVFYFTCGWLSLLLPPVAFAWTLRVLTWWLLAWSWRRMSYAVAPWRWSSILTAAVFVCLVHRFDMAGEWVVGGVEAKGSAYVLVFLGLEAMARNRWNRVWILFGAAGGFHVLVGGWSVLAGGMAWLLAPRERTRPLAMLPGLACGFLLSLPGLLPSLMLTRGVDPAVVDAANQIHVFDRLGHHLNPTAFSSIFVGRFLVMTVLWILIAWTTRPPRAYRRIRGYVVGTLVLAAIGTGIGLFGGAQPSWTAGLLRFYWFRLSDAGVPIGMALAAPHLLALTDWPAKFSSLDARQRLWAAGGVLGLLGAGVLLFNCVNLVRICLGVVLIAAWLVSLGLSPARRDRVVRAVAVFLFVAMPIGHMALRTIQTFSPSIPPADAMTHYYGSWRAACDWIAHSGKIEPDARFLTPRMAHSFKWHAHRSEVVNWKDVPQDAESIVAWDRTLRDIHASGSLTPTRPWHASLADALARMSHDRILRLADQYDADYAITLRRPYLDLEIVYENRRYVIYRLPRTRGE